jgi:hypothetical protein
MNQPIRTQTCQSSPCNGQFIFFKEDVEREQKVEKKIIIYLEQEKVFSSLPSLIFFSSLSLSSLKLIFFFIYPYRCEYLLSPICCFSSVPLSYANGFFFSLSRHPFSYLIFFLQHWPTPKNVNFFYFPLSL